MRCECWYELCAVILGIYAEVACLAIAFLAQGRAWQQRANTNVSAYKGLGHMTLRCLKLPYAAEIDSSEGLKSATPRFS